ncbi:MAG: M23 family metallopeptidase [Nanoarchaeota archaeon]
MAGIPQNTTYSKENVASMVGAMKNVGQSIKQHYKTKRVSTAPYQGIANQVQSYAPAKTPTNVKGLGTITTKFGEQTRYEAQHPGTDIANKIGTPIPAFTPGKVAEVVTGKKQGDTGFGNYVVIVDSQGNKHRYSHLNNAYVSIGQPVTKGMTIGEMGNTGQTYSLSETGTGSHLDYRIRDAYNKYISPYQFINQ